jgi:hypothetical protein
MIRQNLYETITYFAERYGTVFIGRVYFDNMDKGVVYWDCVCAYIVYVFVCICIFVSEFVFVYALIRVAKIYPLKCV